MGQKKLKRFAEIETFSNVLQYPIGMAGKWNEFFGNNNAITLELACGKGEYALGLGRMYPHRNCIGIDLKGNRIWAGAKKALNEGLQNVAFLRTQIDKLPDYFAPGEVAEIWLTFPDPQLRVSRVKKRLTHPRFLRLYQRVLQPAGKIHLKTDSPELYAFTKLVIDQYGLMLHADLDDVYAQENVPGELQIKTYYEGLDIAQSNRVHYLCFTLPEQLAPESRDTELKQSLKQSHEEAI
ncbi:MAG TPA: tRNA (guanosine(46)-N7)-methyltransferase TrmB [Chitinophagaceae bacterium]|nr:tRNA (guanosine(46)-N7)-methyltransferase TrmB [Chitinophagaceae bacterium]